MKALADCRLYGILDLGYVAAENVHPVAEAMIAGGIDILQLRAKAMPADGVAALVEILVPLAKSGGIPLIVNDHPRLAAMDGVAGVHIGQDDGPISVARAAAGPGKLVGRSTHSLAQARAAVLEGADYLGFGPLFATPTKPDYAPIGLEDIARVHAQITDRPIFCIGGIKLDNLPRVIAAGARRAVIVSGILLAPDIAAYTAQAVALLRNAEARA
jgi:thiamine-phosphate pyrophosphorylase